MAKRNLVKIVVNEEDDEEGDMPNYYKYGTPILAYKTKNGYYYVPATETHKTQTWAVNGGMVRELPKKQTFILALL